MTDLTVTAVMTRDPVAVAPFVGLDQRQQRGTRHAARSQLRWSTQGPHRVAEPARKGPSDHFIIPRAFLTSISVIRAS